MKRPASTSRLPGDAIVLATPFMAMAVLASLHPRGGTLHGEWRSWSVAPRVLALWCTEVEDAGKFTEGSVLDCNGSPLVSAYWWPAQLGPAGTSMVLRLAGPRECAQPARDRG